MQIEIHSLANLKSLPLVELVGSGDALEFPEIGLVKVHGFGVSASDALSQVGVMESLAVAELVVSKGEAKSEADKQAAGHTHVVGIEVLVTSTGLVVGERTDSSESTADHGGGATKDCVHGGSAPEVHVEVLRVELDELSSLDLALHVSVSLLHVVFVSNNMRAVSSHFNF